ncbi:hypothetical protein VTL71DRAFT_3829 [Oculimacula yallundae]|uniref:Uncharacterized protein n=1 Tax=Oculimacula yallundae TaxID=86028 RepID=A0ABR4C432_9HELO
MTFELTSFGRLAIFYDLLQIFFPYKNLTEISFISYTRWAPDTTSDEITQHEQTCQICSETPKGRLLLMSREELRNHAELLKASKEDSVRGMNFSRQTYMGESNLPGRRFRDTAAKKLLWGGADDSTLRHQAALLHKDEDVDYFYAKPIGRKVYATRSRTRQASKEKAENKHE